MDSADLAAGLKAARELQALSVPAVLGKQLSNYALRAERVLAARSAKWDGVSAEESRRPLGGPSLAAGVQGWNGESSRGGMEARRPIVEP